MNAKPQTFYLTFAQIIRLSQLAKDTGLKKSEHIRIAVDEYLERKAAENGGKEEGPGKTQEEAQRDVSGGEAQGSEKTEQGALQ